MEDHMKECSNCRYWVWARQVEDGHCQIPFGMSARNVKIIAHCDVCDDWEDIDSVEETFPWEVTKGRV